MRNRVNDFIEEVRRLKIMESIDQIDLNGRGARNLEPEDDIEREIAKDAMLEARRMRSRQTLANTAINNIRFSRNADIQKLVKIPLSEAESTKSRELYRDKLRNDFKNNLKLSKRYLITEMFQQNESVPLITRLYRHLDHIQSTRVSICLNFESHESQNDIFKQYLKIFSLARKKLSIKGHRDYFSYLYSDLLKIIRELASGKPGSHDGILKIEERLIFMLFTQPVNDDSYESCCIICYTDFEPQAPVVRIGCQHQHHFDCIINWYKSKPTCPHCQLNFRESEEWLQLTK